MKDRIAEAVRFLLMIPMGILMCLGALIAMAWYLATRHEHECQYLDLNDDDDTD